MIFVDIQEEYQKKISPEILIETAQKVLAAMNQAGDEEIQIIIADDASLQSLNNEFMGIDAPTDVLSFPLGFDNPESGSLYLGDIIISYQTAERQAAQGGHETIEEIKLLIVHGMLHLMGYDHYTPKEKADMWAQQDRLLDELNIKATPTE